MKKEHVFESPLAGRWYSMGRDELTREVEALRPTPPPERLSDVCAVVVPHAGYRYSGGIAADVFARLDPAAYDRVIIIGPSHHVQMPNRVSLLRTSGYATPLGTSPADTAWMERIRQLPELVEIEEAHRSEHSDQIQVPLIQHFLGVNKPLVCLVMGRFAPEARTGFAARLRPFLDRRTLVVVSTDFTHFGPDFGYVPFTGRDETVAAKLRELDEEVFAAFANGDEQRLAEVLDVTGATVCGREVMLLLLALKPNCRRIVRTGYTTSGEILRNWTNSVSYVGAIVQGVWDSPAETAQGLSDAEGRTLLAIARDVVTYAAEFNKAPPASTFEARVSPALRRVRGAFVTLTLDGRLRGCIGEILPVRPLWIAVHDQARNAAVSDYRFHPLAPEEVPRVHIEISVLTPPAAIASWRDIEVGRHGVVMQKAGCSVVFLPQVAPEQGWDCETMLTHLSMKAGLSPDAWRDGAEFSVFEAQVFGE